MALADLIGKIRELRDQRGALVPLLMESLIVHREDDPPGPKLWLGVSRIPEMCPRALVMAHRLKVRMVDDIDLKGRWRMDRGTALHMVVQELWLGPMGNLLGGWQCPRCAFIHGAACSDEEQDQKSIPTVSFRSSVPRPSECRRCALKNGKWTRFRFVEPEFRDFDLFVQGKSDGLLHLAPNPIEVLDLKTTENLDKSFTRRDGTIIPSVRDAPRKNDVAQLQWYLDAGSFRSGRLLYFNPGAATLEEALVEHQVAYDAAYIHAQKEKVRGLREALEDETRPVPRCPHDGAGTYGECPCVEVAVLWARSRR